MMPTETTPPPPALPMEVGEKTPILPPPSPVKKEQVGGASDCDDGRHYKVGLPTV